MVRKKTTIFLSFIVLFQVFQVRAVGIQNAQAIPSSNHISVVYRPQEITYYCGPAVVQMALGYLEVALPSQNQLAEEMQTDPVEGVTYTYMMHVPFEERGFSDVYEASLELQDLKEKNGYGYLTIILIYFSTAHVYQHYVLVVGYNGSGVFVHDPWPVSWGQPEGRRTGADVYISNELLADLWACEPSHWALIIPYSESPIQPLQWWQQCWYIFLIVPVLIAVAVVSVAIYIKRSKASNESFK